MPNWNVCCRRAPTPFFPPFFSSALWLLVEYYSPRLRRTGKCKDKAAAYQATQHEKNLQIRPSGYKFTLLAQPERVRTWQASLKTKANWKLNRCSFSQKSTMYYVVISKSIMIFEDLVINETKVFSESRQHLEFRNQATILWRASRRGSRVVRLSRSSRKSLSLK